MLNSFPDGRPIKLNTAIHDFDLAALNPMFSSAHQMLKGDLRAFKQRQVQRAAIGLNCHR